MVAQVVVWWTMDSLRRDVISTYGGEARTKHLTQLAEQGRPFHGRSLATWTLPSVTSILTGQPPEEHKVVTENDRLPIGTPTLPQYFRAEGWETIGIVANPWFSARKGLDIGFDTFYNITEDRSLYKEVSIKSLFDYIIHPRTRSGGMTTDRDRHHSEPLIADLASEKVRRAGRPVFVMVHTQGAHSPYHHPAAWNRHNDKTNPRRAAYHNLVEFIDAQFGRFNENISDDSIVVVTSDHGEALGEGGEWGHKIPEMESLYDVPLIIKGDAPSFSNPVSHIEVTEWLRDDIAPAVEDTGPSEHFKDRLAALGYVDGAHEVE